MILALWGQVLLDAKIQPFPHTVVVSRSGGATATCGEIYVAVFSSPTSQDDLMAAEGLSNDEIARRLDTRRDVVSMWRKRFFTERIAGLEERARPGHPRTFSP